MENFELNTIGIIKSPFKEKFGTPRQPGLAKEIPGKIVISKDYSDISAFTDLDGFSHVWVIFIFHNDNTSIHNWSPKVRPPRLGGNKKISVFATRSPNRPNRIGMSLVSLDKIYVENKQVILDISGHDLIDETPILDIKPYHGESDRPEMVRSGWLSNTDTVQSLEVVFEDSLLNSYSSSFLQELSAYLSLDPRPAFHNELKTYKNRYDTYDISWTVENLKVTVLEIKKIT